MYRYYINQMTKLTVILVFNLTKNQENSQKKKEIKSKKSYVFYNMQIFFFLQHY